jgi:sorbitol-specific phosphotransferase system component IIBC
MSDIVRLFLIIILLIVGLVAYLLVVNALFAPRTARTRSIAQTTPARSFGIGFVNFVFFAVIALVLFSVAENTGPVIRGILTIPAMLILALLTIALSVGLAGMSSLIGERLLPDLPAWKQMLWGTVCLALACALPFVGWFLLLPYVGFVGIGAVILGFFQREKA